LTFSASSGLAPLRFLTLCYVRPSSEYPASLELHKIYRVLPDEDAAADGDVRVIDESGEDYLYPADYFVLIDLPEAVEQSLLQTA
jgi:hypothetical protein